MRRSKYNSGDDFAPIQIDINNSDRRIVFFSGLGSSMRRQGEPFIRRFALLNQVSYLAFNFDAATANKSENENFGLTQAFDEAVKKISQLEKEKLILLGPCFGSVMAYHIAQKFPQKVEKLIMLAPPLSFDGSLSSQMDNVLKGREIRAQKMGKDDELLKKLEYFRKLVYFTSSQYGHVKTASPYTGPIQIIHGDNDGLVPLENSYAVQGALARPNVEVCVVPGGKHNFDIAHNNKMRFSISALKKHMGRS